MNELSAISAILPTGEGSQVTIDNIRQPVGNTVALPANESFASMLSKAIADLDNKVAYSDRMVTRFAIDDSTPIHHVTIALEEARMAVELATQVRQRLTEGYRQLINMQL